MAVNCVVPAGRGSGLYESGSWEFWSRGLCVRACVCLAVWLRFHSELVIVVYVRPPHK